MKNYFLLQYGKIPCIIGNAVKYYAAVYTAVDAAVVKHPIFKRELIYKCQEGEELLKVGTVSSVVGTYFGSYPYFGRIRYFIMIKSDLGVDEIAFVDWYGRGSWDTESQLWLCEKYGKKINPIVHVTCLSRPLVHAWEETTLWILNFNVEAKLWRFR